MSRKFSEFLWSEGSTILRSESFAIAAKESLNSIIVYKDPTTAVEGNDTPAAAGREKIYGVS